MRFKSRFPFLFLLSLLLTFTSFGQTSKTININGNIDTVEVKENVFFVRSLSSITNINLPNNIEILKQSNNSYSKDENNNWAIIKVEDFNAFIPFLKIDKLRMLRRMYAHVDFVLNNTNNTPFTDLIEVELFDSDNYEDLLWLTEQYNLKILRHYNFNPLKLALQINAYSNNSAINVITQLSESNLLKSVSPIMLRTASLACVNDPLFSEQWGFKNTTNPQFDINACNAWQITKGKPEVKVAVIDANFKFSHPDMNDNWHPRSFDSEKYKLGADTSGSGGHAVRVSSNIGANHNNIDLVGLSPDLSLMAISNPLGTVTMDEELTEALNWARNAGAQVINCSWGFVVHNVDTIDSDDTTNLVNAINNAWWLGRNGLGTPLVFISGNEHPMPLDLPVTNTTNMIVVGASTKDGKRASFSQFGKNLDLVAPGDLQPLLHGTNDILYDAGTSFSAPLVAATAGLILSEHPSLTADEVKEAICTTAIKLPGYSYANTPNRPYGLWNNEVGYGLLQVDAALNYAKNIADTNCAADLFMNDFEHDIGKEPNTTNRKVFWDSPDIWIRNRDNGEINWQHQDPEYRNENTPLRPLPNYVYVRVRNNGCKASDPNAKLALYWAKASTGLAWPRQWDNYYENGQLRGDLIDSVAIGEIKPGDFKIVKFPWYPPNPSFFSEDFGLDSAHFCLLARILDGFNLQESESVWQNTKNNNGIAWKNVSIVDNVPGLISNTNIFGTGRVFVRNPFNSPINNNTIFFDIPDGEIGENILNGSRVKVDLGNDLYNKWLSAGAYGHGVEIVLDTRYSINTETGRYDVLPSLVPVLEIVSDDAYITGFPLNAGEVHNIRLNFSERISNLLTPKIKKQFVFDVIQAEENNGNTEIFGGERFIINNKLGNLINGVGNLQGFTDELLKDEKYNNTNPKRNKILSKKITNTPELTSIYFGPNPSTNYLDYSIKGLEDDERISLEIYNPEGRLIKSLDNQTAHGKLPLQDLAKSTYLLKIKNRGKVIFTGQFLKQ